MEIFRGEKKMEMRTENVEMILNGHPVHLSNDDIAYIVVELVEQIQKLEKRVDELESELYALTQTHSDDVEYKWERCQDGTRIFGRKGDL